MDHGKTKRCASSNDSTDANLPRSLYNTSVSSTSSRIERGKEVKTCSDHLPTYLDHGDCKNAAPYRLPHAIDPSPFLQLPEIDPHYEIARLPSSAILFDKDFLFKHLSEYFDEDDIIRQACPEIKYGEQVAAMFTAGETPEEDVCAWEVRQEQQRAEMGGYPDSSSDNDDEGYRRANGRSTHDFRQVRDSQGEQ